MKKMNLVCNKGGVLLISDFFTADSGHHHLQKHEKPLHTEKTKNILEASKEVKLATTVPCEQAGQDLGSP